ncbi:hypothetical protein KDV93_02420 [Serratia ureilytica]|nr:hypothetical protein [Serratia marcescens]HBB6712710.1 hypothetical protein [Serratia marcescens]
MKKIVGLKQSKAYSEVQRIIKLRNTCAHNDARLVNNDGQPIKEIFMLLEQYPDIIERDGNQVMFHEGALLAFLSTFAAYIKEIETIINPPHQKKKLFP